MLGPLGPRTVINTGSILDVLALNHKQLKPPNLPHPHEAETRTQLAKTALLGTRGRPWGLYTVCPVLVPSSLCSTSSPGGGESALNHHN